MATKSIQSVSDKLKTITDNTGKDITEVQLTGSNVEYSYNTGVVPAGGTAQIILGSVFIDDFTKYSELVLSVNESETLLIDYKVDLQTFRTLLTGYTKLSATTVIASGTKYYGVSSPIRYIGDKLLVIITNNDTTASHSFGLVAKFKK